MHCPYCAHADSKVIDSRDVEGSIRRRRECLACGLRFTTHERVETVGLLIIKKDGRREEFDRAKLTAGIRKACEKRPLPTGAIEKLVDDIEGELMRLGKAELPSAVVGEMVMERLRELDHIAYIRFASVYREFRDVQALRQELESLVAEASLERESAAGGRLRLGLVSTQPPLLPREELESLARPRRGRRRRA